MQFTTYSSAVSVTKSKSVGSIPVWLQNTGFLTYGTSLNSLSVGDKGCFHIRDAILVLSVI